MWRSEDGSVETAFPFHLQVGLERLNLSWAARLAKSTACLVRALPAPSRISCPVESITCPVRAPPVPKEHHLMSHLIRLKLTILF